MSFDEQPDGDIHGECAFEIHSLQQQLASCQAALADTEALEIGTGERLAKVEQQLAAAIAACNLKNIAIQDALWDETWWRVEAVKALAIQPDDSALKAFMLSKGVSYE